MKCPSCSKDVELIPGHLQTVDLNDGTRSHYLVCKFCGTLLKEGTHFMLMVLEIENEPL